MIEWPLARELAVAAVLAYYFVRYRLAVRKLQTIERTEVVHTLTPEQAQGIYDTAGSRSS